MISAIILSVIRVFNLVQPPQYCTQNVVSCCTKARTYTYPKVCQRLYSCFSYHSYNQTTNGVLRDAIHILYKGVFYGLTVMLFHLHPRRYVVPTTIFGKMKKKKELNRNTSNVPTLSSTLIA